MLRAAVLRSTLVSSFAGWRGTNAFRRPAREQPQQLLTLYEMENCPFCRLVREALTELDLDVLVRPCPKRGTRFRPEVQSTGGKLLFPYLADSNTGTAMYESADIMEYLAQTYGGRVTGTRGLGRHAKVLTSGLATLSAGRNGLFAAPSRAPEQPLVLYSFESSPFSRLVRERLCELQLPYELRNAGKASLYEYGPPVVRDKLWRKPSASGRNRTALTERTGRVQLPYLIDPNTGSEMYESRAIVRYLDQTYAL